MKKYIFILLILLASFANAQIYPIKPTTSLKADSIVTTPDRRFVTDTEKTTWSNKIDSTQVGTQIRTYLNGKYQPFGTGAGSATSISADSVVVNSTRQFVSTVEKGTWNTKTDTTWVGNTIRSYATNYQDSSEVGTQIRSYLNGKYQPFGVGIVTSLPADSIITTTLKQFVSNTEKTTWNGKTDTTWTGSAIRSYLTPYTVKTLPQALGTSSNVQFNTIGVGSVVDTMKSKMNISFNKESYFGALRSEHIYSNPTGIGRGTAGYFTTELSQTNSYVIPDYQFSAGLVGRSMTTLSSINQPSMQSIGITSEVWNKGSKILGKGIGFYAIPAVDSTGSITDFYSFANQAPYKGSTGGYTNYYTYYSAIPTLTPITGNAYHFYGSGNAPSYFGGNIEIDSIDGFYYGKPNTDGTWRIQVVSDTLRFQRRESGVYVNKTLTSGTSGGATTTDTLYINSVVNYVPIENMVVVGYLTENRVINGVLFDSNNKNALMDSINTIPKNLGGKTVTINLQGAQYTASTDSYSSGTDTEGNRINLSGFSNGTINLNGVYSADVTTLPTYMQFNTNMVGSGYEGKAAIRIMDNTATINIKNLRITVAGTVTASAIFVKNSGFVNIDSCYLYGQPNVANEFGAGVFAFNSQVSLSNSKFRGNNYGLLLTHFSEGFMTNSTVNVTTPVGSVVHARFVSNYFDAGGNTVGVTLYNGSVQR